MTSVDSGLPGLDVGVESLRLAYRADSPAVIDDLTCEFAVGTLTLLTGPSGCGKSTLLYALGLMLRPASGLVRWGGESASLLSDGDRAALRSEHLGFVFQDALLDLSRSALENVLEAQWLAGQPRDEQAALALLDRFGVRHRAGHRPAEISGGQAQRIALCRALIKRPALILADEPTGNLDAASALVVWEALADAAAQGATVIVATHETSPPVGADVLRLEQPGPTR